jgi:peptidoglycan/LPS O-acetylase OafA/YrhL
LVEPQNNLILWALRALLNNCFNGQAAVIVFFVISGFCIHFPNRNQLSISSWTGYYLRRYVRILIPMGAAIALALPLKLKMGIFSDSILWSLLCEEVYYLIYPLLLRFRDKFGWPTLLIVASGFSAVTILTNPLAKDYPSYGPGLNWALGLPCWLIGVRLAERLELFRDRPVSFGQIWAWRVTAWMTSVVISVLRFHTPIGHPWTLNLFAIFAGLWLQKEIAYYSGKMQIPILEKLGDASYSIYLTHVHGATLLRRAIGVPSLSASAFWWLVVLVTTLFSSIFYWCVERPSHRLARNLSQRFKAQNQLAKQISAHGA